MLMGLRSNELLKAKWEDIDWDMGTLFIGLTKNGEPLLAFLQHGTQFDGSPISPGMRVMARWGADAAQIVRETSD